MEVGDEMETFTVEMVNSLASSQVAFGSLFILLLVYVLRTSEKREAKLQEQLDKIIPILDNLVRDVNDIKNDMKKG